MVSNKQIVELASRINPYGYEFEYVGIRAQPHTFGVQVGDILTHRSSVWLDGDMCDALLDGVCAIDARTAHRLSPVTWAGYDGKCILLLGSNHIAYGYDEEEIIMSEPVVLSVIEV